MKHEKGFTLIELLVTISVLAILSTVGVAAFVNYSRTQILQSAASDLYILLQIARSRAASQVKPSPYCNNKVFEGYKVILNNVSAGSYEMDVQCSGYATTIQQKTLPTTLMFDTSNPQSTSSVFFYPITGGVSGSGTITIKFSQPAITGSKTITIYSDGRITVN